jgi:transcriptional regulator with XRE-family HTH domain
MTTLGERIAQARREKAVRERRDVTMREAAKAVGVTGTSMSEWESNKVIPREDALAKLAAFLGVTPAYLRYGVVNADGTPELVQAPTAEEIAAREGTTVSPPGQPMAEFLAGEAAKKKAPAKKIGGRKRAS